MSNSSERRVAVIIEDDVDIRCLLETVLEQAGFDTVSAGNGLDGVEAVRMHDPLVTTLDVSMPGIDGFEAAKRIRAFSSTYIVMLTARSDEIDILQGLDSGADDYVTKPFRPRELRARVEAMLRRPRSGPASPTHEGALGGLSGEDGGKPFPASVSATNDAAYPDTGGPRSDWLRHRGLSLQPEMRLVRLGGIDILLTRSEFDLLHALLESGQRVRSKADLALMLRGESYATSHCVSDADKRAIEVHVANLRRKLGEDPTTPRWIETVRGVGYRLTAPEKT
ncbi:response regulator transcription factor [Luethyella okanaganae]|uniref:Response regulator transcription factor n=1 Tax=Luethyella okanaganae TaxID=69372 RepID=A0ABW1V9R7_9MICO